MFFTHCTTYISPKFKFVHLILIQLLFYFQENVVIFLTSGEDKKGMMLLTGPKDKVLQLGPQ